MNYCFPGDEVGFKWTVLVGRERMSGSWMAAAIPTKGATTVKFSTDKCLEFVEESGDRQGDIIVKSDQEASVEYWIKDVASERKKVKL